ncbi:MAG: aminopeptidase P family protein [Deltaproteobacteria bacterium]|nr:aminopeptidase P family protein [Deltaproteobacteria bacterium]
MADAGVKALHDDARVGLKEYELAAIVEYRMRSLGAEDNFGMVVANSHNHALHPPTDRVVHPGDIIIGEITPCIGGLFVQICRTMVLGRPAPVVQEKYAIWSRLRFFGARQLRGWQPD